MQTYTSILDNIAFRITLLDTTQKTSVIALKYDIDPATITRQTCIDLYVGKAMLAKADEAYKATTTWAKDLRVNEAPTEGFDMKTVSIERNVIKPIVEDGELF